MAKGEIAIRLISTRPVPESRMTEARQNLMRRTGRGVQLSVDAIASKSELADLMQRLARPVPAIPKEKTVSEMEKELLDSVRPAIEEIWPSSDAPIRDFDVVVGSAGVAIGVRYHATRDLGDVPITMVLQSLRAKLAVPDLTLRAERIAPPRGTERRKRP